MDDDILLEDINEEDAHIVISFSSLGVSAHIQSPNTYSFTRRVTEEDCSNICSEFLELGDSPICLNIENDNEEILEVSYTPGGLSTLGIWYVSGDGNHICLSTSDLKHFLYNIGEWLDFQQG